MAVENITLILNETVNQTSVQTDYFNATLLPRIRDILLAPSQNTEMLWTLVPMIVALVLMQLYFGRNKDEALGWNTAFGNSIALIFISVSLLRSLYISIGAVDLGDFAVAAYSSEQAKLLLIAAVFVYGLILALMSFFHWLPESVAFFITNSVSVNVSAYVVIVLTVSEKVPLDLDTLWAGLIIFVIVYLLSVLIRLLVPASAEAKRNMLRRRISVLQLRLADYEKKASSAHEGWWKSYLDSSVHKNKAKIKELESRLEKIR